MLKFKNKKITIMGLGLHGGGLGVAKFLAKAGAKLTITDLKSKKQLASSIKKLKHFKIKYVLGRHYMKDFIRADMIIQNPGVPRDSIYLKNAKKNKIPIETDLTLFFSLCPSKNIIGITGTKGKSTTTGLVYSIMKAHKRDAVLGGNIRISPLESLSKIKNDTPIILELSSWQLEGLGRKKISPHYALVTNVLRDHLNTYNGIADYASAKALIWENQKKNDFVVFNKDNPYTRRMGKKAKSQVFWYSKKPLAKNERGSFLRNGWIVFKNSSEQEKIISIKDIKLKGEHNFENVLAAVAMAMVMAIPPKIICNNIKKFTGLEGRLEFIREVRGVKYYNDTTATAPDALVAALNSFKQKVVLLAGGTDKQLEFHEAAKAIKNKTRDLILFQGTATEKLLKELHKYGYKKKITLVKSMSEAFCEAKNILRKGDIFLLSPGAASFGIFINEFDRGDQFNKEVKKIK
ncbi:UDP-N-acetylmuramoyl-L-alanine--D-glutamate ligase [Candidatus Falkowbacteria bacterium]|nr:UDP-N-acetylmuramoyl-L-alanine--D-glutamate ligase [Candidatus Falkowbacteria bacterium]